MVRVVVLAGPDASRGKPWVGITNPGASGHDLDAGDSGVPMTTLKPLQCGASGAQTGVSVMMATEDLHEVVGWVAAGNHGAVAVH
jgi:hypothetical protein